VNVEERIAAYVDGELTDEARATLEREASIDPALAARIAREQGLRMRLTRAFEPVLAEPIPERLQAAVSAAVTIGEPARRAARFTVPQWGALAASLLLGVIVGAKFLGGDPMLTTSGAGLTAGGALESALTSQLPARAAGRDAVIVGLTFKARSGEFCRTFTARTREPFAGLACRDSERWRIDALAAMPPVAGGDVRAAGSALPSEILAHVTDRIEGEPLDAEAEADAQARGWRP